MYVPEILPPAHFKLQRSLSAELGQEIHNSANSIFTYRLNLCKLPQKP